jgi:hypothetical protein
MTYFVQGQGRLRGPLHPPSDDGREVYYFADTGNANAADTQHLFLCWIEVLKEYHDILIVWFSLKDSLTRGSKN